MGLVEDLHAEWLALMERIMRNQFVNTCDAEQLDRFMSLTSTVQPLPGDTFGYYREESDESLRARILEKKRDQ